MDKIKEILKRIKDETTTLSIDKLKVVTDIGNFKGIITHKENMVHKNVPLNFLSFQIFENEDEIKEIDLDASKDIITIDYQMFDKFDEEHAEKENSMTIFKNDTYGFILHKLSKTEDNRVYSIDMWDNLLERLAGRVIILIEESSNEMITYSCTYYHVSEEDEKKYNYNKPLSLSYRTETRFKSDKLIYHKIYNNDDTITHHQNGTEYDVKNANDLKLRHKINSFNKKTSEKYWLDENTTITSYVDIIHDVVHNGFTIEFEGRNEVEYYIAKIEDKTYIITDEENISLLSSILDFSYNILIDKYRGFFININNSNGGDIK